MRFPARAALVERAAAVLRRFPWPLAVGAATAAAAIAASFRHADDVWLRAAFVLALGLPLTTALTLLAEVRSSPSTY